jgi:hypothetical protein
MATQDNELENQQQQGSGGRQQQYGDSADTTAQQSQRSGDNRSAQAPGEALRSAAANVKQEGKTLAQGIARQASELAEEEKGRAGAYVRTVSRAIQSGAQALRDDGFEGSANAVDHLAEQLGDLLQNFETKDPRQLLEGANGFARSNPVAFLSASLVAGFGMARVIKAAGQAQSQDGQEGA